MDYRVIILADRSGAELSPLDRVACPALLEVGGRCVIEYTLEDLSEVGAQEVVIVSAHVDSLRERLGDGGRWGRRISYLLTRPEQSPNDCVRRITGRGPVLLVRGDIVRGRCVGAFLRLAEIKTYRTVAAVSHRMDAGICLINGVWTHGCTWPSFELGVGVVEIGGVGLFRLESLRNLHAACLAASRGEIPGVEPAGRDMGDGQVRCRLSQSDGVDLRDGRLFVSLENTVVMPGTYIGREVELKNAIIAGRHLIRIDINATTEVPDDFLLSPVHHSKSSAGRVSLVNRAAGIALLALSAPLWPIAIVISHMGQSPQHRIPRTFLSNVRPDGSRREFTVRELETSVPALRNLPWLIPVARGDLRLFGVRPSEPGAVSRHEDDAPAGIIGPALLDVGPDASDEEIALGERVFAGTRNNTNRPRYLLRSLAALFSARAWLPAR
jgi:hypothetical protein